MTKIVGVAVVVVVVVVAAAAAVAVVVVKADYSGDCLSPGLGRLTAMWLAAARM
jgi:hypothetical protein